MFLKVYSQKKCFSNPNNNSFFNRIKTNFDSILIKNLILLKQHNEYLIRTLDFWKMILRKFCSLINFNNDFDELSKIFNKVLIDLSTFLFG